MPKESSLITTSSTVKKLLLILFIIAILVVGWNTFKDNSKPIPPVIPINTEYSYLPIKSLTTNFEPIKLSSVNGISLYSKQILSQGEFPVLPGFIFIYKAHRLEENFGTFKYANNIATKLNFTDKDRTFSENLYIWENNKAKLTFDRRNLSVEFIQNSPSLTTESNNNSVNSLESYISNLGIELNNVQISDPLIFKSSKGEIKTYFTKVDFVAMNESSLAKYLTTTKLTNKADIINNNQYYGQLVLEITSQEKFERDSVINFKYDPINIDATIEDAGIYKLIPIEQAYQEINTFRVETESTNQENIQPGSLYNFIVINKLDYNSKIDVSEIDTTITVSAKDTKVAYVYAESNEIGYLHPIYIFSGEGKTKDNIDYIFYIYVDALPKKQ